LVESQVALAQSLKIGQVANRSGLTVKSIRFYCDEVLIKPISRSDGGYRLARPCRWSDAFQRTPPPCPATIQ
jgi:hypothetical protein